MGIVNRLHRWIGTFLFRRPYLRHSITVLGITAFCVIVVFPVYYEKDIQAKEWELWALIGLALIAAAGQLQPLALGRAGIDLKSFSEITRELRQAILVMPMERDEPSKWSFDDWKQRFDFIANLIERQVDGLLGLGEDDGVACNLMVVLPPNFAPDRLDKAAKLDDRHAKAVAAYEEGVEGASSRSDTEAILFIAGRGKRARTRTYPSIFLKIPMDSHKCLPGAPSVYHKLLLTQEWHSHPPYEYLPNPQDKSKTEFHSGVGEDAKNAFVAHFTRYQAHMASFISVGLLWSAEKPIGVLNIDSHQEAFLDGPSETVTMDLLTPYSEIATAYAVIYVQRLTKWLEDSDET